jgi:hypothetical protein
VKFIFGRGGGGPENEVDSNFKNVMAHGRLDSIIDSYSIPEIEFSSHNLGIDSGAP